MAVAADTSASTARAEPTWASADSDSVRSAAASQIRQRGLDVDDATRRQVEQLLGAGGWGYGGYGYGNYMPMPMPYHGEG